MCVSGRVRECACSCAKRDGSRRVRECVCSCAKRDGSRMCVSGRVRECVCSCAKRDGSRVCVSAIDARSAHVAVAGGGCVSSCRVCGCRPSERAVRARARRAERRAAPDGAALPACRGLVACRVDARSMHVAASGGGQVPSCRTCGGRPSERVVRARARRAERRATPDGVALTACCGTCRSCPLLQHWRPCSRPSPRRTCGGRPSDRAMRARARRAERREAFSGSACCGTCRCFLVSRQPRPRPSPSPRKTRPPPAARWVRDGGRRRRRRSPGCVGALPATRVGNFTAQGRHHTGKRRFWRGRTVSPPVALLPPC